MTCPDCARERKARERLEARLREAEEAVAVMTRKWLAASEGRKK